MTPPPSPWVPSPPSEPPPPPPEAPPAGGADEWELEEVEPPVPSPQPVAEPPAPKIGETNALQMGRLRFTCPSNLTGLPAIVVPCGLSTSGLPLGLQLVGKAFDEATILRAAYTYEAGSDTLPVSSL